MADGYLAPISKNAFDTASFSQPAAVAVDDTITAQHGCVIDGIYFEIIAGAVYTITITPVPGGPVIILASATAAVGDDTGVVGSGRWLAPGGTIDVDIDNTLGVKKWAVIARAPESGG